MDRMEGTSGIPDTLGRSVDGLEEQHEEGTSVDSYTEKRRILKSANEINIEYPRQSHSKQTNSHVVKLVPRQKFYNSKKRLNMYVLFS